MTNVIELEYNSQKDNLIISEYGRYVQELVDWCKTIEDPQARQIAAENVIEIMRIVNPQKNANEDTTDKLWQHMFRIADYELDVTSPTGDKPVRPNRQRSFATFTIPCRRPSSAIMATTSKCWSARPRPWSLVRSAMSW